MAGSSDSARTPVPPEGTLLGVDFGTRRLGLALSTPDQSIASPLELYALRNPRLDGQHLREIAENYRVRGLVIGLPIHLSGEEGESARKAREFGGWLAETLQLPLEFWDERYTSAVAEEYLLAADLTRQKRKQRRDMVAAQIILQSFLDHRRRASLGE